MHGPSLIFATVPALAHGGASPASVDLCSYSESVSTVTKSMCERSQRLSQNLVDDMVGLSADRAYSPVTLDLVGSRLYRAGAAARGTSRYSYVTTSSRGLRHVRTRIALTVTADP